MAAASGKSQFVTGFRLERNKNITIRVNCRDGVVSSHLNNVDFALVDDWRIPDEINNIYDISCTNWPAVIHSVQKCDNRTNCELEYQQSWLKPECQRDEFYGTSNGYLKLKCACKFSIIFS